MDTRPADRPLRLDRLRAAVADLLWGSRCVGCGAGGAGLCAGCALDLQNDVGIRSVAAGDRWLDVYSAARYADAVARAVPALKERGRADLLRPLADGLARAVSAAVADTGTVHPTVWLVPVPQTRRAHRDRGASTVLRLTRAAARTVRRTRPMDVRIATSVLRHVRSVDDQARLGRAERQANLAGALGTRAGPMLDILATMAAAGASVVLVDDVVTTGSTLAECARALESVGIVATVAAVVADTPIDSRT